MEKSTIVKDGHANRAHLHSLSSSSTFASSSRDFSYSCGACGYELNLSSSSRNVPSMGAKYGKSIKRGIISFFSIDESRFMQVEEFQYSSSADEVSSKYRKYDIRIRALQPSSSEEFEILMNG